MNDDRSFLELMNEEFDEHLLNPAIDVVDDDLELPPGPSMSAVESATFSLSLFDQENTQLPIVPLIAGSSPQLSRSVSDESDVESPDYIDEKILDQDLADDEDFDGDALSSWISDALKTNNMPNHFTGTSSAGSDDEDEKTRQDRQEMDAEMGLTRRKKGRRKPGAAGCKLPRDGLIRLGQANQAILDGQYDQALEILRELVKQYPSASEPYQTMGMIYEDTNELEKSLLFYLLAVHLKPNDVEMWRKLAGMSRELNLIQQSYYCLRKAIKVDPSDADGFVELAELALELGRPNHALDNFKLALELEPGSIDIAKEIAKIYYDMNNYDQAIDVVETTLMSRLPPTDHSLSVRQIFAFLRSTEKKEDVSFDFIHIMSELYLIKNRYEDTLQLVEEGCLLILNGDRGTALDFGKVPLDLRIRYAIASIHLKKYDTIKSHLDSLSKLAIGDVADLFLDVAEALRSVGRMEEALEFYEKILVGPGTDDYSTPAMWSKMAGCCVHLGKWERARTLYEAMHEVQPRNREIMMALIRCLHHLGESRGGLNDSRLGWKIDLGTNLDGAAADEDDGNEERMDSSAADLSKIFLSNDSRKVGNKWKSTSRRRKKIEGKFVSASDPAQIREKFEKCKILFGDDLSGKQSDKLCEADLALLEDLLSQLVFEFQTFDEFFRDNIRSDVKEFPVHHLATKNTQKSLAKEDDYDDEDSDEELNDAGPEFQVESPSEQFSGLTREEWVNANIMAAFILFRKSKKISSDHERRSILENSFEILRVAYRSTFVRFNAQYRRRFNLYMLSICLVSQQARGAIKLSRQIIFSHKFSVDAKRLLAMILSLGPAASDHCYGSAMQKYYIRKISELESEGSAGIIDPYLYVMIGNCYSHVRSFVHAINYYARAYQVAPSDSMVNLLIGIGFLHRAMQRKSSNRHAQIVYGVVFLDRYRKLRQSAAACQTQEQIRFEQECCYNIGRAMQMINLVHRSVHFYERAIQLAERLHDGGHLKYEACYNLSVIYFAAGSLELSQHYLSQISV